jgi:general secretion pathway protein D
VNVVADEDTNSLLIMTAPKNYTRVKQVIDELDRAVPQVLIKVLLAEVSRDNSIDLGTEWSVLNLRASGNGQTIGTDYGLSTLTRGLVVKVIEDDTWHDSRAESAGKLMSSPGRTSWRER